MRAAAALVLLALAGCAAGPAPGEGGNDRSAAAYTGLGIAYLREGKLEQALDRLQRAIAADPGNATAHSALGVVYERMGREAEADRHYRRAVELAPEDPNALNNLGRFLCARGGREEAMRLFERAASAPGYGAPWVAWTNAGLCALAGGDRAGAEARLRRALQLNPRFAPALLPMVGVSLERGRALSARGYLQRYHEVAPPSAESLWLGVQVEQALGDRDAAARYASRLRSRFPDSPQARALEAAEEGS
ncbi:type IV pilus biogenesis/stability protein PilW [Inmirania thermothiophila]|uniref:Type IV pilus assembly protein PilF n=1 Tax=Inmirania thermothiophila TaxID=1750597 RepID=A0A3N1XU86_9GAMM|nr:type IV pilus biogenesis/stability protein PilW [Inmirania thermothiophila]ROR29741.1 type IV pilus assembly protein PilF [Inmirania thermothiophila]